MRITELPLEGLYQIDIEPQIDERGFFARTFCAHELEVEGLNSSIVQCSTSYNIRSGTLRGMHYQIAPHAETKIVRCTAGAIFDVVVDIRRDSATYGKAHEVELTQENHRMLYIPVGFAHGFQTLEDRSEVLYQMSVAYNSSASRGFRWDDPNLQIAWPIRDNMTVSNRDCALPTLREADI